MPAGPATVGTYCDSASCRSAKTRHKQAWPTLTSIRGGPQMWACKTQVLSSSAKPARHENVRMRGLAFMDGSNGLRRILSLRAISTDKVYAATRIWLLFLRRLGSGLLFGN